MNDKINKGMTCRQARQALLEDFDEGRRDSAPKPLAGHLETCDSCRGEKERLLALAGGLKRLPVPDPGDNFRVNLLPAVRLNLDKQCAPRAKKDMAWAPSMGLAILLAVALVRQPAPMAPPSWYQTKATALETSSLADQDYERLSQALEQRDSLALDLSGPEMDMILSLSDDASVTSDDPVVRLSTMSDEAVEAVLKKVESASIRS